jgi:hypothetical protein
MRAFSHLFLILPLLAGCGDDTELGCPNGTSGTASLEVTPVKADALHVDTSSFDITVTGDAGEETLTVALDEAASFAEVAAGVVQVTAEGSWSYGGDDTGGEGCNCHAERELLLCDGDARQIVIDMVCDDCW